MDGVGLGTTLGGRYTARSRVGGQAAGRGAVERWRAVDTTFGREVVLACARDDGQGAAVLDAARLAAGIDSPVLVRVLDAGREGALVYVVEEPCTDATTLTDLVHDGGLPGDEVRRIVGETAQALDAAAQRGLHHVTLGPDDVLRTPDGEVKLRGVAVAAAAAGLDGLGSGDATRRDAVGVVALTYAGLTGMWPLPSGGAGLPVAPRVGRGVVAPSEVAAGIPRDLDALCRLTLSESAGPVSPGDFARQVAPWSTRPVGAAQNASTSWLREGDGGGPGAPWATVTRPGAPAAHPGPPSTAAVPDDPTPTVSIPVTAPGGGRPAGTPAAHPTTHTTAHPATQPTTHTTAHPGTQARGAGPAAGGDGRPAGAPPTQPVVPVAPGTPRAPGAPGAPGAAAPGLGAASAAGVASGGVAGGSAESGASGGPGGSGRFAALRARALDPVSRARRALEARGRDDGATAQAPAGIGPGPASGHPAQAATSTAAAAGALTGAATAVAASGAAASGAPSASATAGSGGGAPPAGARVAQTPRPRPLPRSADSVELEAPAPLVPATPLTKDESKVALWIVGGFVLLALLWGIYGVSQIGSNTPDLFGAGPVGDDQVQSSSSSSARPSPTGSQPSGSPSVALRQLGVIGAESYDPPPGDGRENDAMVSKVFDDKKGTEWTSERYNTSDFGGLKKGVGVILDVGPNVRPREVVLDLPVAADVSVYLSEDQSLDAAQKIGSVTGANGEVKLTAKAGPQRQYVIVWFTNLSRDDKGDYRAHLAEVQVLG